MSKTLVTASVQWLPFLANEPHITQLGHYFQAAHLARAAREHFVPLEISAFPERMPSSSTIKVMLHMPPVSKTANIKTWLTFIQSNIANLICVSFAVQYTSIFKTQSDTEVRTAGGKTNHNIVLFSFILLIYLKTLFTLTLTHNPANPYCLTFGMHG